MSTPWDPPIEPSDLAKVMASAIALKEFRVEELSAFSGVNIGVVIRIITDHCDDVFASATSSVTDLDAAFELMYAADDAAKS